MTNINDDELYICPVCGSAICGEYDICDKCGWENDLIQREHPDLRGGANIMSLNEAIVAYKRAKRYGNRNDDFMFKGQVVLHSNEA